MLTAPRISVWRLQAFRTPRIVPILEPHFAMARKTALVPTERILSAILLIRDQKVMLDSALAELYGVETRALVQAVKRNGRLRESPRKVAATPARSLRWHADQPHSALASRII